MPRTSAPKKTGKGISITTIYKGKRRTCAQLAKMATEEPRPSALTIYWRLWRLGKPGKIDGDLAAKVLAPVMEAKSRRAGKSENKGRYYTLLPDNTMHTSRELHDMFGVPRGTLGSRRLRKNPQTAYTREELLAMAEKTASGRLRGRPGKGHAPENNGGGIGDLAHLSGTENTGAGRGEIPDEIWCNRKFGHHCYGENHSFNLQG